MEGISGDWGTAVTVQAMVFGNSPMRQHPSLLFMTDIDGIHGPDGLVNEVDPTTVRRWVNDGVVSGGMVPKVEACLAALDAGVERVTILNGKKPHALLIELLTDAGLGTLVCA
jgi:acetylglutamate kinase